MNADGSDWHLTKHKFHPMPFSRYKIVETSRYWFDYGDELITIGRCAHGDKGVHQKLMTRLKNTWGGVSYESQKRIDGKKN